MLQNPKTPPAELSGQPAYTLHSSAPPGAHEMVMAAKYDGGSVITAWDSYPSQSALYQPQTPQSAMRDLQGPYGEQAMYGLVAAGSQSREQGQGMQCVSPQPSSQSSGSPGSQGWADLAGSRTATPLGYERQWSGPAQGCEEGREGRVGRRMVPGDVRDRSLSS